MTRLADAIASNGFSVGRAPMLDLKYGGQNGFAPNLAEWGSNQSYVRKPLVCILMEAPKGFQYLPDPAFWVGALKAMLETHAKTIDGFNNELTVEVAETAVSGGGEMQQDPIKVNRSRSKPTFTFVDKYGKPIQTFLREWMSNLIMDADSSVPNIATLAGARPNDLLADMYSFTALFFEPDPTHRHVQKAWLSTNMYPLSSGPDEGKRDLPQQGDTSELSIEFSALTQTGLGVRAMAQTVLNNINFANANPNMRPAFVQSVSADVAASTARGYKAQAEQLGSTAIRP